MKVLDLFAGIGGFSLAAHWMGWKTVQFVEKEPFCQKVLNKNFPGVPIHDDIFTFSGEPFRGRIDIITGGFPCQPFSAAGKRKGRADERHLFPEMLRVISEVRPRWVVAENVRGLLSIESGQVFSEVITSLEGEGYEVITFCVPASAVEAPHRRDRLWIVANTISRGCGENGQSGGVEGIQRGRQNDAMQIAESDSHSNAAHTASNGYSFGREETGGEVRESEQGGMFKSEGNDCFAADAEHAEGYGMCGHIPTQHSKLRNDNPSNPNANSKGLEGRERSGFSPERYRGEVSGWQQNWPEVAARLCGMDDGVPAKLDIVGSRDNRVHRLKALGNSIVPQIAFELFKAIQEADDRQPTSL